MEAQQVVDDIEETSTAMRLVRAPREFIEDIENESGAVFEERYLEACRLGRMAELRVRIDSNNPANTIALRDQAVFVALDNEQDRGDLVRMLFVKGISPEVKDIARRRIGSELLQDGAKLLQFMAKLLKKN